MVLQLVQEQPEVIQAIFRKDKTALEELLGRKTTFDPWRLLYNWVRTSTSKRGRLKNHNRKFEWNFYRSLSSLFLSTRIGRTNELL